MMNSLGRFSSVVLVAALVASCAGAQQVATPTASVPRLVNFSSFATDGQGKPVPGVAGITFAIYGQQSGGAPLWLETQNVTVDAKGNYTAQLGATKPSGLALDLFSGGEARWLGVRVNGGEEQPRILLLSVPYALKAADAETIGGLPPSAFVLAPVAGGAAPVAVEGISPQSSATGGSSMSSSATSNVTTTGGTISTVPLFTSATNIQNSALTQTGSGATAKIGIDTITPVTPLDVKGAATVRGNLSLPATGSATATAGKISQSETFTASAFNSSTSSAVNQNLRWQAEVAANNTAAPSGSMNLLYGSGSTALVETGFKIASNGRITFAAGQTFPGTGPGTITGVTAGTDLTGGGTSGVVTLRVDTTKVPQLAAANTFTGNQTVNGNVTATGAVTGSRFQIGSSLFGFGSPANENAFLGFAGNTTMTGSFDTAAGVEALQKNTTGQYDTAVGAEALQNNTTGLRNTALGASALSENTTGTDNTAVGSGALNTNQTGINNTAVGSGALTDDDTGSNNTAVGETAMIFTNTGSNNTAVGQGAMNNNQAGSSNTATGYQALAENQADRNTADGYEALQENSTGTDNVATGEHALLNNDTGADNTAVGAGALESNTSGNKLTCVGYLCSSPSAAISNATAIGANSFVSVSNSVVLGSVAGVNGATATAKVGIGTTTPTAILTIGRGAGHPVSDSWETYSSRRWKTNIRTLPNALAQVEQLRGVTYDLKDSGKHEIGVIAEEVGAVVPEVVTFEENGKDARGVDYSRLTALLIEATKQQQREIQELKTELRATRQSLRKVKAQVNARQTRVVLTSK
jgi:hypothetical protein